MDYDYVIVGGGSAGCALAARLADGAPQCTIALIEAGPPDDSFLVRLLNEKCNCEVIVPDPMTVDFKEALVFAFLGLLRRNNRVNVLASVTGATRDSSSGSIYSL